MEVSQQKTGSVAYKSPRHAQVWFLLRSRRTWKGKYKELKIEAKRLRNRVADTCKSREKWRREAEEMRERVRELEAENAQLREMARSKKRPL
jgi:predicted nuclease with TOPRIM domain